MSETVVEGAVVVLDQVQEELDALAVRLGHSLTIDGVDGELLAYSSQRDADPARVSSILLRQVAPDVRQWEDQHLDPDATGPMTVPANPDLGMSARLCMPLRRHGRTLGHLWMLGSTSTLGTADVAVLRRSSEALAGLLDIPARTSRRPAALGREADRLIGRLLDEGQVAAYDQLAVAVPGLVEGSVQLVAAVAAQPCGGGVRLLRSREFSALSAALTPTLRAHPAYVGCHVSTTCAFILLHHRDQRAGDGPLLAEIDEVTSRCLDAGSRLTLGVSQATPLTAPSAREIRAQALAAAELAALDPALDRHTHWEDLGPYRSLIAPTRPAGRVLTPLDDAGASASMLLETLETFLDLAGDVRATSARLNLHRSSLYYRLDRISRLLDADLADGLVRLDLHLALKTRRVDRRPSR